jgi:uncharacterized membrane protein YadS
MQEEPSERRTSPLPEGEVETASAVRVRGGTFPEMAHPSPGALPRTRPSGRSPRAGSLPPGEEEGAGAPGPARTVLPGGDRLGLFQKLAPGIALSAAVALVSTLLEPMLAGVLKAMFGGAPRLPAIVIALLIGMALHRFASRPAFQPGITYCVKKLLRIAIGLLGLRIALGDIVALGLGTSITAILRIGWRHVAIFFGTTLVLLVVATAGLFLLR